MVSASRRWLIDTITPRFMHVPMTLLMGTSIIDARSLAVTNSVSFRVRLSAAATSAASRSRSARASRFSLRHFTPRFWPLSLVVRRASTSFTCFCTSSSFTSLWLLWPPRRLRSPLPPPPPPRSLRREPPPCEPGCCWPEVFSMSIFSLPPMRLRFLRSPEFASPPPPRLLSAAAFAMRSFRRSSFVFFLGRVDWLMAERSILPTTLIVGMF